jgi:hypothetical protein
MYSYEIILTCCLSDPLLPPYYEIENCILIASACDMWEDADVWRRAARQAYHTFHAKASRENDTATLEVCNIVDIQARID